MPPMSPAQPNRKPWPLKWIILVTVLVIGPYTYLRWHFRKPGPAFAPYHDITERANTQRLLSAGFQRITIEADRPADAAPSSNNDARNHAVVASGGLPPSLANTLVEAPQLPVEITSVSAAAEANTMFSYKIEFNCTLPDNHRQPAGAQLFIRGEEIIIVPELENLAGDLLSRARENRVRLAVAPGALKPGRYRVTLVGAQKSRAWDLTVK
jgi:hypothetical protein